MATVSKNVYFDVLDDIANKYKNTVYRTIEIRPIDVTSDSYAEYNEDSIKKDPKFKVGDRVRVSKCKIIFKGYTQNESEELFVISKMKDAVPWTYAISDLNGEPSLVTGSFDEKELQKASQEKFRIEEVIKKKGDKLYVKWKGHDNSFNSQINKKDLE